MPTDAPGTAPSTEERDGGGSSIGRTDREHPARELAAGVGRPWAQMSRRQLLIGVTGGFAVEAVAALVYAATLLHMAGMPIPRLVSGDALRSYGLFVPVFVWNKAAVPPSLMAWSYAAAFLLVVPPVVYLVIYLAERDADA